MKLMTPTRPMTAKAEPFTRLRGTIYPFVPPPATRVDEMTAVGTGDPLADQLSASIASTLQSPFLETPSVDAHVAAYVADMGILDRIADEATRFLQQIVEHYLSGTPDPALRSERVAELMQGVSLMARPQNVLSAEFLARHAHDVESDLAAAVLQSVAQLVAAFSTSLRTFTKRCVCGLIDRPNDEVCRFTFFDEILTKRTTKSQKRKRKKSSTQQVQAGKRVMGFDTVTTSETTDTDCRFTRHEHHLMNVTELAPGFARWPVPTRVEVLIVSAPSWVRPQLRIVEGTVVVERTITWESSKSATRVIDERDVPVYAPDPALVLGDFVLAGWSEEEIRTTTALNSVRADRVDGTSPTRTAFVQGTWTVAAVIAALVTCQLLWRAVSESSILMGSLAAVFATCATCAAWRLCRPEVRFHPSSSTGADS
jgi:hypothetical protein